MSVNFWFSCDVTPPQNPQIPLFLLQKWIQLGHVSQVANVWFSSHNFGEVAVIQKFQHFQNNNMACHPTWPPHIKLSLILGNIEIFVLQLLRQIMTRKPA